MSIDLTYLQSLSFIIRVHWKASSISRLILSRFKFSKKKREHLLLVASTQASEFIRIRLTEATCPLWLGHMPITGVRGEDSLKPQELRVGKEMCYKENSGSFYQQNWAEPSSLISFPSFLISKECIIGMVNFESSILKEGNSQASHKRI